MSMKMRKSTEQAREKSAEEARCRMLNPDLHMLHVRCYYVNDEGSLTNYICKSVCVCVSASAFFVVRERMCVITDFVGRTQFE